MYTNKRLQITVCSTVLAAALWAATPASQPRTWWIPGPSPRVEPTRSMDHDESITTLKNARPDAILVESHKFRGAVDTEWA